MVRLEGHLCQFLRDGNYLFKANTGGAALNPHPRGRSFLAYKEDSTEALLWVVVKTKYPGWQGW